MTDERQQQAHLAEVNGFWENPPECSAAYTACSGRRRYADMIKGFDPEGRVRCLVLTWDGVWHPASPTTGNLMRRADTFDDGERARHNGAIVTRRGYAMLTTDPPRTIWIDENNTTTYIFAHDLVEVLP